MIALKILCACAAALLLVITIDERLRERGWATGRFKRARVCIDYLVKVMLAIAFAAAIGVVLTGCADTINPVRYQTVEVLVTKPCLAGRTPPAHAVLLTDPVCTLPAAECVRAAAADIAELQRETRESRNLIRECSK